MTRAAPRLLSTSVLLIAALIAPQSALAATLNVAAAANFARTAEALGRAYAQRTGDTIAVASASSGKLYTQIVNGAPFDLLFSADTGRPQALIGEGLAFADSQFVYARGVLALYAPDAKSPQDVERLLHAQQFAHLAIANPKTAPYGAAAIEVLRALGLLDALRPKLVTGESIGQAFQFVATGNAGLGLVALSQIEDPDRTAATPGAYWLPPPSTYTPIEQSAVILKRTHAVDAARRFIAFVRSAPGRAIIERYGYTVPTPERAS